MADLHLNLLADSHLSLSPLKALDLGANLCKFPLNRLPITSECLVVSLIQLIHTLSHNFLHYFSNNWLRTCFKYQFLLYNTCYIKLDVRFSIYFISFALVNYHEWLFKLLYFPM